MMGSKAFELPLIPHARMRALYRGLVETRLLMKARVADAALVAAIIDLQAGDLVSLPHSSWVGEHIRQVATRESASRAQIVRSVRARASATASPLATLDRLLLAAGMATALKPSQKVVIAFADALSAADWKHLLRVALGGELPLVLVTGDDVAGIGRRLGAIPVIPVDGGDVVALYRVAQETIVRARADGGIAVIRCVACGTDPEKLLATQLIAKKICTSRWVAGVEARFRKQLAGLK